MQTESLCLFFFHRHFVALLIRRGSYRKTVSMNVKEFMNYVVVAPKYRQMKTVRTLMDFMNYQSKSVFQPFPILRSGYANISARLYGFRQDIFLKHARISVFTYSHRNLLPSKLKIVRLREVYVYSPSEKCFLLIWIITSMFYKRFTGYGTLEKSFA